MNLYLYSENCTRQGQIAAINPDPEEVSGDWFLYGEGSQEDLIAQAVERLSKRFDTRPGGAGDSFDWRCALNVIRHLDGPSMIYDEAKRAYFPEAEEEVA